MCFSSVRVGIDAPYACARCGRQARPREGAGTDSEIDHDPHRACRMTEREGDFRNQLVVERDTRADANVILRRRYSKVRSD